MALEALPTGGASALFSMPSCGARASGHRLDRAKFQFEGSPKNMSEKIQKFQTNKHTMWIGNVRNLSFQDQLRATIAVDLNELSMTPLDFDRNLAKGLSARHADDGCRRRCESSDTRSDGKLGAALALGNIGCRLDGVSWLFAEKIGPHPTP